MFLLVFKCLTILNSKPMYDQKDILDKAILDGMGTNAQMDDCELLPILILCQKISILRFHITICPQFHFFVGYFLTKEL